VVRIIIRQPAWSTLISEDVSAYLLPHLVVVGLHLLHPLVVVAVHLYHLVVVGLHLLHPLVVVAVHLLHLVVVGAVVGRPLDTNTNKKNVVRIVMGLSAWSILISANVSSYLLYLAVGYNMSVLSRPLPFPIPT
jgi:uncharacterized membrane protein